ncbi:MULTISPECIES: LytR/AlgR family response regulator transcription factor [Aneurinibacillus]|nr:MULTISPECIES: LytTR family transcriptional regulator DNA-binding domain-containing protein [Aneurinibacillus]MED0679804.1 LytTR family transcriptional regulator DNA-binding domain-containing protein [Aneurinibacillus thermoaerophilus]QYY44628.1 LytTR family transcriptional regulator DNA-binding domain-containing protein [Aneurinibacillus thermoaerophilus]
MIRVIIVDDEAPARSELRYLLEQYDDIEVIEEAASGEEAIELIQRQKPDVVFLDIYLHDIEGIKIPEMIEGEEHRPHIVYATAYDSYALQAFETEAADYILKPFNEERLKKTMTRLRKRIQEKKAQPASFPAIEHTLRQIIETIQPMAKSFSSFSRIPVEKATSVAFVDIHDIVYAAAEGRNCRIFTKNEDYITSFSLQELEKKLPEDRFYRIHRTYLVNLSCIVEFIPWFKGTVQIKVGDKNETVLPVSRSLVKDLKMRLGF